MVGQVVNSASYFLLITDDETVQYRLSIPLQQQGFKVLIAGGIDQAIELADTHKLACAYMDLSTYRTYDGAVVNRLGYHLDDIPLIVAVDAGHRKPLERVLLVTRPIDPNQLVALAQLSLARVEGAQADRIAALEHANECLRLENERLYEAIGMTGHDWRTLITRIQLLLAQLNHPDKGLLTPQQLGIAGQIRNLAFRLDRTATAYLQLSRLEFGQLRLHAKSIDLLEEVIRPLLGQLAALNQGQAYSVRLEGFSPRVYGDPDLLISVFDNLIGNAIKYGHEGSPISIRIIERRDEVDISIANTGPGIEPAMLEHIFDRYTRAGNSLVPGFGLGLYLVRRVVEAHGGRVWAESTADVGVTITFTLPKSGE